MLIRVLQQVGRVVAGVGVGCISVTVPIYASECASAASRGKLVVVETTIVIMVRLLLLLLTCRCHCSDLNTGNYHLKLDQLWLRLWQARAERDRGTVAYPACS
ncbi:MFS transporter [Candidatus Bathyarchaeota archaeon]|nr:MFS transporter [Candidatus Bathyarchaeota archaeon]